MLDENYYQVSGWMINRLKLKGIELQIYAIIYGFTQDGETEFTGSINYLCNWTGCSRSTVIRALKDLTKKGLLLKRIETIDKCTFTRYRATLDAIGYSKKVHPQCQNDTPPVSKCYSPQCQNDTPPSVKMIPNNNNNIIINNNNNNNIHDFDFDTLWRLYPKKRGKSAVSKKALKELEKAGIETVKKAIECYKEEIRKNHTEDQYIMNGSTFFNGRWQDYLTDSEVIADNGYGNIGTVL